MSDAECGVTRQRQILDHPASQLGHDCFSSLGLVGPQAVKKPYHDKEITQSGGNKKGSLRGKLPNTCLGGWF
jgi:hypothetical protein